MNLMVALDTATNTAGLAVGRRHATGLEVLAATSVDTTPRAAGHSHDLLCVLDGLLKAIDVTPTAIEAVVVGAGPGSFTGLRIGMATAKGIAYARGCPLWSVSSLAALAQAARPRLADGESVIAVMDARRGEVFVAAYLRTAEGWTALGPEVVLRPEAVAIHVALYVPAGVTRHFVGDAWPAYAHCMPAPMSDIRTPSGVALLELAMASPQVDVLERGVPVYIRPSEAEVNYPNGVPGALRSPVPRG